MSIHTSLTNAASARQRVFGSGFLPHPLPKFRLPKEETDPEAAYQLVHDELLLDGNSRQNLATFCQTWSEPQVHKLMAECIDKNLIDRDEYPQTSEIESRCVHMLSELWNAPAGASPRGCSTTGSSEAAMLCGLAMKERWKRKREKQGKTRGRPNMICGLSHTCWPMFARYFEVELRQIPCVGERLMMSPEEVVKLCDENTIGVVGTMGTTFTLQYEPIARVAAALDDLEEERGLDIPIHVDAASGGFIAPFIHPKLVWDFRLPRVRSINASGHKFGMAPLGCGWAVWQDAADLPSTLVFPVDYLGGTMSVFGLNFSRPAGEVVAQYYNFVRLGRDGFARVNRSCADVAQWFADQLESMELFDVLSEARSGIPGCVWTLPGDGGEKFTLYHLANQLRLKGWQVPVYPMPPKRRDLVVQRAVMRLGVSRDLVGLLLDDMRKAVEQLRKHPPATGSWHPAGGYNHT
ncbi:MAG TPA: glutamate decarboxylase [Terracidiphilus sp.]|nr:glutamate decarboxylase [Terracidiphilus sp.]